MGLRADAGPDRGAHGSARLAAAGVPRHAHSRHKRQDEHGADDRGAAQERNLRVGRFTSPHLVSIRERITVDGEPLSEERFAEVYEDIAPYVELIDAQGRRIQFFESLTAMAFAAFADTPVDVAVIEAGMGGTWDATNVADGTVAVITRSRWTTPTNSAPTSEHRR